MRLIEVKQSKMLRAKTLELTELETADAELLLHIVEEQNLKLTYFGKVVIPDMPSRLPVIDNDSERSWHLMNRQASHELRIKALYCVHYRGTELFMYEPTKRIMLFHERYESETMARSKDSLPETIINVTVSSTDKTFNNRAFGIKNAMYFQLDFEPWSPSDYPEALDLTAYLR